jgi:hypothetical protein
VLQSWQAGLLQEQASGLSTTSQGLQQKGEAAQVRWGGGQACEVLQGWQAGLLQEQASTYSTTSKALQHM